MVSNFAKKVCLAIVFLLIYFGGPVAAADFQNKLNAVPITNKCYSDGDIITLRGIASFQLLTLANDTTSDVWLLITDKPVCVVESSGNEANQTTNVTRFQIVGSSPPVDAVIELKGKLSTDNITQYYAEPNAIRVISGRRISNLSPIPTPQTTSTLQAAPVPTASFLGNLGLGWFIVPLIPFFLRRRWQKWRKREVKNKIVKLVMAHVQSLSRKRSQMVYKDDYGTLVTTAWEKQKIYFRDTDLLPVVSPG